MAFNLADKNSRQITVSVFGSLCTEMSPESLPDGVSPDNQDVVFQPGGVKSRPGLSKVIPAGFPAGGPHNYVPTITYAKSFVTPTGQIENLYLDSNGNLWWEDVVNNPGVLNTLSATAPGLYAKSITAFGREYIAISDGLHGQEAPLQWDGTNLDRVTQDGPAAPPGVSSVALPSVAMVASGAPLVLAVTECDPAGQAPGGSFGAINLFTSSSVSSVAVGSSITIAGNSSGAMNGTWTVTAIYPGTPNSLVVLSANLPAGTGYGLGGSGTLGSGVTMQRSGNFVTVTTSAPHQLQVGYQAQITGVLPGGIGGSVVSYATGGVPEVTTNGINKIVISNSTNPGIATVTTIQAHGLKPGANVNIIGVQPVQVGGGITSISCAGGVVTVVTNQAHGLTPGSVVQIGGTGSYDGTAVVASVSAVVGSLTQWQFTYAWTLSAAPSPGVSGTVSITWPIPDTANPTYFEVLTCPTSTTFQVAVNYGDGTWFTGAVLFAWSGTFFVTAVPTANSFTYQQYGPDATATDVGTVTPYGQAAAGIHQCQVMFLTRQGYLTRPSPPVQFIANGGQYLAISNIPVGPPNVVARVLAFTGASGAYFFYIPTVPQVNGQIVGTATQINDNTSTSAFLDFSDPTLFASTGIGIPGNDPASQIILDGALGFGFYGSRLLTWGQRNRIQNLLNMGFEGGSCGSLWARLPLGWTAGSSDDGQPLGSRLVNFHFGMAWNIAGNGTCGVLSQSMYEDAYGAPIATANTRYRLRAWFLNTFPVAVGSFVAQISSASTGFSSIASIPVSSMAKGAPLVDGPGSYLEADFSAAMPAAIPADLVLTISGQGGGSNFIVDDISILYAEDPYLDNILFGSYVNNPEAFDGVTGKFGPSQDSRKVMDCGIIRQTLYILTREPSGRLHDTNDNGVTEPASWTVNEIAANCGLLSAFALTKSQADDSSAAGGEEWLAWASSSGARIFWGSEVPKLSQEIQPDWDAITGLTTWALNDPVARVIYFGLPSGTAAPNLIYPVDYKELETAGQIAASAPIRNSYSGRLVATDHTRKWTRWNIPSNGAALMYRQTGKLAVVIFGGNKLAPGTAAGHGNVYTLDSAKLTDDDYGQIFSYYTTYFAPDSEQEQFMQLGGGRKMLAYVTAFVSGVGTFQIAPFCDVLSNPWAIIGTRTLSAAPTFDLEWAAGNAQAQRIALKFASVPVDPNKSLDNSFNLSRVVITLKVAKLPVRGSAS